MARSRAPDSDSSGQGLSATHQGSEPVTSHWTAQRVWRQLEWWTSANTIGDRVSSGTILCAKPTGSTWQSQPQLWDVAVLGLSQSPKSVQRNHGLSCSHKESDFPTAAKGTWGTVALQSPADSSFQWLERKSINRGVNSLGSLSQGGSTCCHGTD